MSIIGEFQPDLLDSAREAARREGLAYAGELSPRDAWAAVAAGQAVLLDVRTVEERAYVGRVPDTAHVAWATGTAQTRNPRFVREVESKLGKDSTIVLICRSGKRSRAAAEALTAAGFRAVYNIGEGFEGEIDAEGQRGRSGGWRFHGLPWIQD